MTVLSIGSAKPSQSSAPAHEKTYRALREMVLFGELKPGQAVTIQGLTDLLGVSMTPVREAIRRLTAEGALDFLGNRRIVVPELDSNALEELAFARKSLEPELARRAAQRITPDDIAELREIDDRLDEAIRRGDVRGYLEENYLFHVRLNRCADAPILLDVVDGLWLRFGPSLRVVCGLMGTLNLPDRHKDLLSALEQRDGALAAQAMEADVMQGLAQISEGLR